MSPAGTDTLTTPDSGVETSEDRDAGCRRLHRHSKDSRYAFSAADSGVERETQAGIETPGVAAGTDTLTTPDSGVETSEDRDAGCRRLHRHAKDSRYA